MVKRNFAKMQVNFEKIQANFRRLLLKPEPEGQSVDQSEQGSVQNKAPEVQTPGIPAGRPKQLLPNTPPVGAGQEKEQGAQERAPPQRPSGSSVRKYRSRLLP